jgi:hypothetical protein
MLFLFQGLLSAGECLRVLLFIRNVPDVGWRKQVFGSGGVVDDCEAARGAVLYQVTGILLWFWDADRFYPG